MRVIMPAIIDPAGRKSTLPRRTEYPMARQRNPYVRQDDGRPGAGGIPLSFRTLATVVLATS
jgi:hypothetical protein